MRFFVDVAAPDVFVCMNNYHVRLIAPAQMSDEEIRNGLRLCHRKFFGLGGVHHRGW